MVSIYSDKDDFIGDIESLDEKSLVGCKIFCFNGKLMLTMVCEYIGIVKVQNSIFMIVNG